MMLIFFETARKLLRNNNAIHFIFTSRDSIVKEESLSKCVSAFFKKPFDIHKL